MRTLHVTVLAVTLFATAAVAQSGNTTAGLAGIGAGAALGAATGGGSTTPSSGGSAPIEIQVMSFYGLEKIATEVARITADRVCTRGATCAVLIEDSVSSNQLALYHTAEGYFQRLNALNSQFQSALPITVVALPSPLSAVAGTTFTQAAAVSLKNLSGGELAVKDFQITLSVDTDRVFAARADPATCSTIQPRATCNLVISFSPPSSATDGKSYSGVLAVTYAGASSSMEQITFPVSGVAKAAPVLPLPAKAQKNEKFQQYVLPGGGPGGPGPFSPVVGGGAAGGTAASTGTSSSSAPAPPATPYSLQWTNGLSTDAGTAKTGMTYTSASTSPTTQAFAVLVEKELTKVPGFAIQPYTSSSPLNLVDAANDMSAEFGQMLAMGADVTTWTNECSKSSSGPATPQSSAATYTACNNADVVGNLAIAAQLNTSYSTLMTGASDGNGNPTIVDILRGRTLTRLMGDHVPSLQLAVMGAGGSTKTNSFFGVSLFYQFAPSYNAGVIAAFELRNGQDQLIDAGARDVLYGYRKWNPGHMSKADHRNVDTNQVDCGFCGSPH